MLNECLQYKDSMFPDQCMECFIVCAMSGDTYIRIGFESEIEVKKSILCEAHPLYRKWFNIPGKYSLTEEKIDELIEWLKVEKKEKAEKAEKPKATDSSEIGSTLVKQMNNLWDNRDDWVVFSSQKSHDLFRTCVKYFEYKRAIIPDVVNYIIREKGDRYEEFRVLDATVLNTYKFDTVYPAEEVYEALDMLFVPVFHFVIDVVTLFKNFNTPQTLNILFSYFSLW